MQLADSMTPVRDLGSALGFAPRPVPLVPMDAVGGVALFLAGVAVGFGLGVLFAPSSGQATRETIKEKLQGDGAPEDGQTVGAL